MEVSKRDSLFTMNQDSIVSMVQSLQQEKIQIMQSLLRAQQDMTMMRTQYTEVMGLTREKEAQLYHLYEIRRQTDNEESRRYINSLEDQLASLRKQLQSTASNKNMGASGAQDLFAGYREEMQRERTT
ncbi:hypothetical protein BDF14DRAFT_1752883 [Spinellus fusiger]|nr:hypothetical protein BDF14DRAFT_1752883 [Spinellus fusiger]